MSKNSYRYLSLLLLSTIGFPVACFGAGAASGGLGDDDELSRLLVVLDEQTEIATKTKLNADYVPGIVTILRGKELETRGIRNVWEALALVPGVELGMEGTGRRHILIRGVGLTYASETAKIMVNNVSYNTATYAFADTVFSIPIEQVERIEVIRGPGSAVYGEFAYSGVINVITYQSGSKLFGKGTSRQDRLAGWIFSFGEKSGDSLYGTLNVSGENSGRGGVNSGYDSVYQVNPAWSNSPGRTNEVTQTRSLLLDIGYQDYTAKLAWLSNGFGDYLCIGGRHRTIRFTWRRATLT